MLNFLQTNETEQKLKKLQEWMTKFSGFKEKPQKPFSESKSFEGLYSNELSKWGKEYESIL